MDETELLKARSEYEEFSSTDTNHGCGDCDLIEPVHVMNIL